MLKQLFDSRGANVALGKELGKGGEGTVFELSGQPDKVGKVYFKPAPIAHGQKLLAMTKLASEPLLRIAAWPVDTLHDQSRQVVGFTMPKVSGHEPVFKVYGPKLRLREFPKADWRFLIHVAANVARSFSTIHAASLVIGDVNHGNLMVSQDAIVRLIDCDSFQIISGSNAWLCEVGVGTHQPPEMQRLASYKTVIRTPNQDNFGLAVIIFQLLCIARHPFSGVFKGAGEPPSIEDAIAASRYAYSIESNRTQMIPPVGSLPMDALGPQLQGLFERAFSPNWRSGNRPSADAWVKALDELQTEVRPCTANRGHYYRHNSSACPWCEIESRSGVILFPAVFGPAGTNGTMSVTALWQEITSISEPAPLAPVPDAPKASLTPSPQAKEIGRRERGLLVGSWLAVGASIAMPFAAAPQLRPFLIGLAIVAAILGGRKSKRRVVGPFEVVLRDAEQDWDKLCTSWRQALEQQTFAKIRQACNQLKSQHDALPTDRLKRLQVLHDRRREQQLEEHLDRQAIGLAKIPGVKTAKIATLASHGIHTANDVAAPKIMLIPGFGPLLTGKLMDWRQSHEKSFRFDSSKGVPPADLVSVEREIVLHRSRIEAELSASIPRLRSASALQEAHSKDLARRAGEINPKFAQARADAVAAPGDRDASKRRLIVAVSVVVISAISAFGSNAALQSSSSSSLSISTPVAPAAVSPSTANTPDSSVQGNMIMTRSANVRSGPQSTFPVVQVAKAGAVYRTFGENQGWIEIGSDAPVGWVYSEFLRKLP